MSRSSARVVWSSVRINDIFSTKTGTFCQFLKRFQRNVGVFDGIVSFDEHGQYYVCVSSLFSNSSAYIVVSQTGLLPSFIVYARGVFSIQLCTRLNDDFVCEI